MTARTITLVTFVLWLGILLTPPAPSAHTAAQVNVEDKIDEQRLGELHDRIESAVISKDGCHYAYTTRTHGGPVVIDGQPGPAYERIAMDGIVMSPHGECIAYGAMKGDKWIIVVNGHEGPEYQGIGLYGLTISADGKHLAHIAFTRHGREVREFVTVDGQAGPEYDGIGVITSDAFQGGPTFSPDSKHVAYWARKGDKWLVVIDGRPGPECDRIGRPGVVFSPDSKHSAYSVAKGNKWLVVHDGTSGLEHDEVAENSLVFSPDGRRVAYWARKDDKWFVVVDGKPGPACDEKRAPQGEHGIVFSPDSKHVAYLKTDRVNIEIGDPRPNRAERGNLVVKSSREHIVVDSQVGPPYERADLPCFSPDGRRVAYVAARPTEVGQPVFGPDGELQALVRSNDKWFVILDGQPGPEYDMVRSPVFSADSLHIAYACMTGAKWQLNVDGQAGPEYDEIWFIGSPIFSPDGTHVAYAAKKGSKWFIVIDHQPGLESDHPPIPVFSPNGKRAAYRSNRGGKCIMVSDEQAGSECDAMSDPVFSRDGKRMAYFAAKGKEWFAVVDSATGPKYDQILTEVPHFGPDGELKYLAVKGKVLYRVQHTLRAVVAAGAGAQQAPTGNGAVAATRPATELTLDLGNKVTMKLVQIPAGKFLMGSPETEKGRQEDESQHEVTISKPFYMGITPVTVDQFAVFVKDTGYGDYDKGAVTDPTGPDTGSLNVLRGWSWAFGPAQCRSAGRGGVASDARHIIAGFRVVIAMDVESRQASARVASMPATLPAKELTLDLGNKVTLKLVQIPAGKFLMGSPETEKGRQEDEVQHEVTISKPFYMAITPVTVDQFAAFVRDSGYKTYAEKIGGDGASWRNPSFEQKGDHPVVQIYWDDAKSFCDWLSKKSGKTVVLPTEAQWEYACRASRKTAYPWGDNPDDGKGWANCADQSLRNKVPNQPADWFFSWDDGFAFTSPVGSFKPNAFGLYDMIGNVWQWCSDRYGDYDKGAATDPAGSRTDGLHVQRGSSWSGLGPAEYRSAYRGMAPAPDIEGDRLGFRVVIAAASDEQTHSATQPVARATTFNSELAFCVFVMRSFGEGEQLIGKTPSPQPLEIPECMYWCVLPDSDLDVRKVCEEVQARRIPGLRLDDGDDEDLAHLKGLTGLHWLDIHHAYVTDEGLVHLKDLTGLHLLVLRSTFVTDAGLAHLTDLAGLQSLELWGFTDVGLEHLKGLTGLRELVLNLTGVTDAGLAHLKGLTGLRRLSLSGAKITDAGLKHLSGLTGLQSLCLTGGPDGAKITEAGLAHLKGLTGLRSLGLCGTDITDVGLERLKGLTNLQWLDLRWTAVTDVGLAHVTGLTGLQELDLRGTKVTDAAVAQLQKTLPQATIRR